MKRVWFSDFWTGFDPYDNYILDLLRECEPFDVDCNSPDLLIFSNFGDHHLWKNCHKICWSSEPYIKPPCYWNRAFSAFHFPKANYLPIWAINYYLRKTAEFRPIDATNLNSKTEFCNFVYSNPKCETRNHFFQLLHSFKHVHSGGELFRNCDGPGEKGLDANPGFSKRQWQAKFRFTIAFENSSVPGYVSEKLMDAFSANTIPIYWGDPLVSKYFNSKAFINVHAYDSLKDVVREVSAIEQSEERVQEMLMEHPVNESSASPKFGKTSFLTGLKEMLDDCWRQPPIAPTVKDKLRHKLGFAAHPVIYGCSQ